MSKTQVKKPVKIILVCPLCGGTGLIDNGNETKECPLCKGNRNGRGE